MTTGTAPAPLLTGPLRNLTIGAVALVSIAAFEAVAVATAMPTVAVALDGLAAYALAFGLPLATSVLGMVVAGAWSDARGPAGPIRVGVGLFVAALLLAGLASSMPMFAVGRALQGLGSGLFSVALYVVIGQVVPSAQRPRIFAATAAAWVLPAVVGPAIAGLLVEHLEWRWVFLLAAVLVVPAALLVEPALRGLAHRGRADGARRRVYWALGTAIGAVGLHQAGQLPLVPALLVGVAAAVAVGVSLPRLLPPGTVRGRPGLPTVVALRGLISAAFFAAEAFLPLMLSRERGLSPTVAGLVLTVAALSWAGGSWFQGRDRAPARTTLLRVGTASIALGVLTAAAVIVPAVPAWVAVVGWLLAGLGMGLAYPTTSVLVLDLSSREEQGRNASALQIADVVFAAVSLAASGALFAALFDAGRVAYLAGFAVAALPAALAVLLAGRAVAKA